ncbi:DUF1707 and DUF4190 domain-containing protein [Streptomyces flavofungini]|uniref:DUF1707 and DUF4190 domain-containing protein n=1 Tax=Streptomyces flavofungini TaxID=68200 RepID=A0ABS0X5U7_9ACTN|nr:DUF1707 and DUF4190 domain-containing protein [Streptomyces flavofungini]MBJ3808580.1 DUF1707 and DUF4190 domain-containing protein [Streptomyces flavofungini]GHC70366.1 hypothetical protein GCM10010349_45970 [Streptomyces flavofungini]
MTNPSWQPGPWPPHQGLPAMRPAQHGQPSMLAAHSDRERAVDVLRAGFAEGRLQQDEYERRVERAYQARTVGELGLLVADLPQGPAAFQQAPVPVPHTFLPVAPPTNGKATAAMVCGIATFFTLGASAVPAVILGHIARAEIRRTHENGDGQAVAGLALGWLAIAGWALLLLLVVSAASG